MFNKTYQKVITVDYTLNNKTFFSYWKMQKNTDMKKELQLLEKMKKIDSNIQLDIAFEDP